MRSYMQEEKLLSSIRMMMRMAVVRARASSICCGLDKRNTRSSEPFRVQNEASSAPVDAYHRATAVDAER